MILTTVSLICARESAQTLVFLDGFERTESQGITDEVGNGRSSNSEKETKGCTPSKKSRLLKIEVWHPNGLKCTKSWIDSCGNGERRLYQENGLLTSIVFYDHFEYRTEILCDENGKLDEVWAHRGIKREKSIWKVM